MLYLCEQNSSNVKLSAEAIKVVKEKTREALVKNVRIIILGSMVNDNVRGGDTDLYIMVTDRNGLFGKELKFLVDVKRHW